MNAGPARVIEMLRRATGPCSGASLSTELGVSRAQVWKHVERLRARGYQIDGEPGGGYTFRSAPDRLYPEELSLGLTTRWLARSIDHHEETDSTNRVALEAGRAGAPHGHTVVAEEQSAGRGRLGRSFYSPAYLNLYTSIVLRPQLTTSDAPTLILASAVAVAEAIAGELGEEAASQIEIKWPNDVLLAGLKTCGILMEMSAEATRVDFVVLGIGVNLNVRREDFPDEFRQFATSLRSSSGRQVDRASFARRLYSTLETVLDDHARGGFDALRSRYEARFGLRGKRIRVIGMDGLEIEGRAFGIDRDGALLVERDDGERERVVAGDVTLAKETRDT